MKTVISMSLIMMLMSLNGTSTKGSNYPALDALYTSESYTSANWFNCGLQPRANTSTGTLQLQTVSVRGAGSCSSDQVLNLTCEKFRNQCGQGSTRFYACTNGDFVFGERYARGFHYSDMIAPCDPVPDQAAALTSAKFVDNNGQLVDYVLPGQEYQLRLQIKNETSETLTDYVANIELSGTDGIALPLSQVDFGDIPPYQNGLATIPLTALPDANHCGDMFVLDFNITKEQRIRRFTEHFSIGRPVHGPKVLRPTGLPLALKGDGRTTLTIPAVGNDWPYGAKIFKATYQSRISHSSLGDISNVTIQPPLGERLFLFRGDGKRSGSQNNTGILTSSLQGKNGWGDWTLTSDEKDWRQDGTLQSFTLELTPAVFSCTL